MGGGVVRRDESAHTQVSAKPKLCSAQQSTFSGLSVWQKPSHLGYNKPQITGYTQEDASSSSTDKSQSLLGDDKHKPQPPCVPTVPFGTEHLHPTRRYKNRHNWGEFELAFEFVKDKT